MTFREFLELTEYTDTKPLGNIISPAAVFGAVPAAWTGSQGLQNKFADPAPIPPGQTDFDLQLPTVTKTGRLIGPVDEYGHFDNKRNPILLHLSDGTRLAVPYDAYKRIKGGEPDIGKTLMCVLQRRPEDKSGQWSQVQDITVQ